MRLAEELDLDKNIFIDPFNRVKEMNYVLKIESPLFCAMLPLRS